MFSLKKVHISRNTTFNLASPTHYPAYMYSLNVASMLFVSMLCEDYAVVCDWSKTWKNNAYQHTQFTCGWWVMCLPVRHAGQLKCVRESRTNYLDLIDHRHLNGRATGQTAANMLVQSNDWHLCQSCDSSLRFYGWQNSKI